MLCSSAAQATSFPASSLPLDDFDTWRLRLLHYHAAEVYIDMFAEYVALGCSYVILFFCWNHPKYMLRRFHDSSIVASADTDSSDASTARESLSAILGASQAIVMACQLGAEIVVDFASCLLEVGNGIDFRPLQRQSFFFSLLVVWAATGNLAISANMYLHE